MYWITLIQGYIIYSGKSVKSPFSFFSLPIFMKFSINFFPVFQVTIEYLSLLQYQFLFKEDFLGFRIFIPVLIICIHVKYTSSYKTWIFGWNEFAANWCVLLLFVSKSKVKHSLSYTTALTRLSRVVFHYWWPKCYILI